MQLKAHKPKSSYYMTALGFLLPILFLLLIYAMAGIMPFGGNSIMVGDCNIQYSAFLAYFREILAGNVSAAYTFSKVLGGDLASLLSYYLLSPFHIILPLFSNAQIQEAVLTIILLKTGTSGLCMQLYLTHKKRTGWQTLLFSTAYALMGYNMVYQHNIMWLDGLVFLPLIIWGLEKLLQGRKLFGRQNFLYLISLSLLLLTNYYIGYMLCIFAVLYVLYYLFGDADTKHFHLRDKVKALAAFALHSGLAGGLAAVSLLPTAISLHGGKAEFELKNLLDFTILYSPLTVWKELFAGGFALNGSLNDLPKIYCGVFVLVFTAVFMLSKNVALREKIGSLMLLAVLYCSFLFGAFDRIWHGTTVPAGAPHRYSFVFSFFLILVGYKGFCQFSAYDPHPAKRRKELRPALLLYAAFLLLYLLAYRNLDQYLLCNIMLSIIFVLYTCGIDWRPEKGLLQKKHQPGNILLFLLPLSVAAELLLTGHTAVGILSYSDRHAFRQETEQAQTYVDWVKQQDNSWYRMEQTGTTVTMNDAMFFQYNGLWSYSSCEKETTKRLAGKFGLNDRTWWIIYHPQVPAASESFLGLKYIITSQALADGKGYPMVQDFSDDSVQIYQNPYALSLGTLVEPAAAETNMETWDVLAMENDLWKRMTGGTADIYRYANREETVCEEHLIEYRLVVEEELPIYTCFRNVNTVEDLTLWVNGTKTTQFLPEMQTYCLGTFQKGDVLTIQISNSQDRMDMSWYDMYFYYEDIAQLEAYSTALQAQALQLTEFTQDTLHGTVTNPTDRELLLLLTIPADKGWTILVDGVTQPIESVAGGFIGVRIPQGEHSITLSFVPVGLWQGAFVSLASLCILVIGHLAILIKKGNA